MVKIGYSLSSEELSPAELINNARMAEEAGFEFALISDHFHPWTNDQPNSPFVWSVLGAIAQTAQRLHLGTGVTCPLIRIHPAIVAQAAATVATMMPGRFFLGVGTGEYLNEHITGQRWPAPRHRLEMLEEAMAVMRRLWKGGWQSFDGKYYRIDQARIFTMPDEPPPIMVAANNSAAVELAGRCGDGLINFEPSAEVVKRFERSGGKGKPRYGQVTVSYASSEADAAKAVLRYWRNSGIGGHLMTDLKLPGHFEEVLASVPPEKIVEGMPLGPEVSRHLDGIEKFVDAGFDHVYVHQVGPRQQEFIEFYSQEVLPRFNRRRTGINNLHRKSRNGRHSEERTHDR
jgi:coenzyme F420-dependent glucose-6-phosphate dehydrogenase